MRYGNRNFNEANSTFGSEQKLCNSNTELCTALKKIYDPSISATTNRIVQDQDGDTVNDYTFDAAGNTTHDPQLRKFTYDAENKQTKVETINSGGTVTGTLGEYFYDGDGKRVKKIGIAPGSGDPELTIFVYDAAGKQIAEYSTVVADSTNAKVAYLTNDHLGSPRINTDANGAVISRHDYHPFGEEIATSQRTSGIGYDDDTVRKQFTGYERDGETDLDFAQARYYAKNHGRFTSSDPLLSSAKATDPRSWNRFSFVSNNPLNSSDPTGLCTAPSGLKAGQVGVCLEAFIAAKAVGVGGLGHGDNRSFAGNDPNLTARVTVWAIISTDANTVFVSKTDQVSASVVGGGDATISGNATLPDGSSYRVDTGLSTDLSLPGTARTTAQLSNIQSKQGEKDFGAGVDVTVAIANGTNGGQQLGQNMQTSGSMTPSGLAIAGAGKVVEAMSPAGTIDGSATLRITGGGQVEYISGQSRGFPSYAVYSYTVGADGKTIQTTVHRERPENKIEDLTKPVTPMP